MNAPEWQYIAFFQAYLDTILKALTRTSAFFLLHWHNIVQACNINYDLQFAFQGIMAQFCSLVLFIEIWAEGQSFHGTVLQSYSVLCFNLYPKIIFR